MTTQIDLDKLERVARAATPGPWEANQEFANRWRVDEVPAQYHPLAAIYGHGDYASLQGNADYIAAANPAVVLEIVRRLRAAEADAKRYQWLRDEGCNVQLDASMPVQMCLSKDGRRLATPNPPKRWTDNPNAPWRIETKANIDAMVDAAIAAQGASHD